MPLSNVASRQQFASATQAVRFFRDSTAVHGAAAAAAAAASPPLGRQVFGRLRRGQQEDNTSAEPVPEALLSPDSLGSSALGSPTRRRRQFGRQFDCEAPDGTEEQPGTTGDSIAVRWTTISMAELERPPSTRPVVAGPSLRSVRTVDNLQRLLEGRPAGMPPAGLLRTQTLPVSPTEQRRMNGRAALSESGAPAEAEDATPDGASNGVPVFVMLPLDSVTSTGKFRYANSKWFARALASLVCTGVRGVAIDVWWGAVERQPQQYDWSGYRALFEDAKRVGLKIQAVMSFHACGGNVGDSTQVPLPAWVLQAEEQDPDLFFRDRPRPAAPEGNVNREYISLFSDNVPSLAGRTPLACYADYMAAFAAEFASDLGSAIEEVVVGSGPCGELRYPSYLEANGWRFPGVGEFQCYDRRALASLKAAAAAAGHPEWGNGGPADAGSYNSTPEEAPFFRSWGGSWDTDYGRFFLGWYSGELLAHGERLMTAAASIFKRQWPVEPEPMGPTDVNATGGLSGAMGGGSSDMLSNMSTTTAVSVGSAADSRQGLPRPSSAPVGMWRQGGGDGSSAASTPLQPSPPAPSSTMGASQSGAGSPWGSAGAASSGSLLSDSTELQQPPPPDAMQTDVVPAAPPQQQQQSGSGPAEQPPQGQQGMQQQQPSGPPQQRQGSQQQQQQQQQQAPQQQVPQQLQPVPEAATASAEDIEEAQRRQAHVPGQVHVTLKVAGLHWWWHTRSHAAEATAGYWNCAGQDGYRPLVTACAKHGLALTLTCVEMCDAQHPPAALCGPEGLLRRVRELAAAEGVVLGGENALPCFSPNGVDATALERIVYNTQAWAPPLQENARRNSTSREDLPGSAASAAAASRDRAASAPVSRAGSGPAPAVDASQPLSAAAAAAVASAAASGQDADAAAGGNDRTEGGGGNSGQQGPPPPPSGAQGPASPWPVQAPSSAWPGQPSQLQALPIMRAFTFLRLSPEMTSPAYQGTWLRFMAKMQNNAKRPAPMPEPHLGLRPMAPPRIFPGGDWVPPPPPPQRPSSSQDG